jgi:hypothetical protein
MNTPGPDLSVPCLRCSRPSKPHGEHHREHQRMGGRGWKAPESARVRDPICRACHDAHHATVFDYDEKDGFYVGTKGEFRSPVAFDNESTDKRRWDVEKLADDWGQADEDAVELYKDQCGDAYAVYERIGWMEEWRLQAALQLSKDAAVPMDWHLVYDRVNSWQTFEVALGGGDAWDCVLLIGEKGRHAVCAHDDPRWALDTAIEARLAGDTVARTVRLVKGDDSGEPKSEMCTCHCGNVHKLKGD